MDSCPAFGVVFGLWISLTPPSSFAQAPAAAAMPSDAEIRRILKDHVGPENLGIGMVVGVIDPKGRRVISYGSLANGDARPLDGDTVFEIGSITKVFTSLVLMEMAEKGEVSVTDSVSKYLPVNVKVPERNGRSITLRDLATHRSGLPVEPPGRRGPLDGYTVEQLYDFLSHYQLARDIGSQFEYSNLGVGLLGYALSLRAGMSYEQLLKARVLEPLGMKDTGITLSPGMKARLAGGHDLEGRPVPNLDSRRECLWHPREPCYPPRTIS